MVLEYINLNIKKQEGQEMMEKKYNIGLDIGTSSVGFAVVDLDNNLIKKAKKNMWGSRLFEPGETAVARRMLRSQRRRINRRKIRISQLQELLKDDVLDKDEAFFIRLKNSYVTNTGIKDHNKNILFNDIDLKDGDFHKNFKTIYHLREYLMTTKEKADIRLIYLALHHIIKYRGHFLYEGQTFSGNIEDIYNDVKQLLDYFAETLEYEIDNTSDNITRVIEIIVDKNIYKKDKEIAIINILKPDRFSKPAVAHLAKAILGNKTNLNKVFNLENEKEELNIYLSKDNDLSVIEEALGDDYVYFEILEKAYSFYILDSILQGKKYISTAMINKYKKHNIDLKIFKKFIKTYFKDSYSLIFRKEKLNDKYIKNYKNYISSAGKCTLEEFYKGIKNLFETKKENILDDDNYKYIIQEIEENRFLQLLNTTENSAIPYQLHEKELKEIIKNQAPYYKSLDINKEKIMKLFKFRVPYYVGPINKNSSFSWVIKSSNEKVYPWNFENVINIDESAEEFILKMTNKCSYIFKEDVIPKKSLLYSEYEMLNEINKIRVDGHLLSVVIKKRLIEEVFKSEKKVSENKLRRWLEKECLAKISSTIEGYQKDKEFATSLTSYIDFKNIFGEITEANNDLIEEVIRWCTLFTDKEILRRKIEAKYPDVTKDQIKKISKLKYSGWSRLSKKLLTGIKSNSNTSIIEELRNSNKNFMQIINDDKMGFNKKIEELSIKLKNNKITYDDIKLLSGSPAIKRSIWQTVNIVKEIIHIMKCEPENIFIEFAREDQVSKRTDSRINRLIKIYETMRDEGGEYNKIIDAQLLDLKKNHRKIDSKALYLYFIQNGKCMYSGEPLDISLLQTYEIDHIIPRSYLKDDSFDNLALVLKKHNQRKSDNLLLEIDIIRRMYNYWSYLDKIGLISKKKFANLTKTHFVENDIKEFINRQLVETRQISKNVAALLKEQYENTSIVTIKASLNSNFREKFELYKNRNINDFHHAHDAYISAIVGNYIGKRYPKLKDEFNYGEFLKASFISKKNKFGFIIDGITRDYVDENGEIIWEADKEVAKIKHIMEYKDCNVSKKTEELTGQFYNQTISSKGIGLIPRKKDMPTELYGGYINVNKSYSVIIEYTKGKKTVKQLVGIPIYLSKLISKDKEILFDYLEKSCGYHKVKILKERIYKYQLIRENNNLLFVASDNEAQNAKQLIVDKKYQKLIYLMNNKKDELTESDINSMNDFFDYFIDKIFVEFEVFFNIAKKLETGKEEFLLLDAENKIKFINELLKLTQANAMYPNLANFKIKGLSDRMGRMGGKNFKIDEIEFISKSVTGMFESKYKV